MSAEPLLSHPTCPGCGGVQRLPDGRCAECLVQLGGFCPGCQAPALRLASFCSRCGTALKKTAPAEVSTAMEYGSTARRPVTVMFCDLVESTALSVGMDPEDFGAILRACHTLVIDIVAAHGGFTAGHMGDGTLVYFGYPQAGEDNSCRAILAGLALLKAIPQVRALGRPMRMRVGIAAGVVVVGDIVGGRGPRGLDVAGAVPNLAARLQSAAEANTLVVDGAVHDVTARAFDFAPLGGLTLRGWSAPVQAWKVVRPLDAPLDAGALRRAPGLPLVGRESEVLRLAAAWRRALDGRGCAVVLVGEMGIGKSRLIADFLLKTAGQSQMCRRWFCSRYLQGVALHPIVRDIEFAAGIAADDAPDTRCAKVDVSLSALPALDRALIAELIAPGTPPQAVASLSPNKRRDMTLQALVDLMCMQAAQRPLLAVFEDYHWSDPTSRAFLSLAVQTLQTMAGLLIVTVRPGNEPDWIHAPGVERIELDALKPADAARLVQEAAGTDLPARMLHGIVAKCDGVPLFIEEVTRAVMDEPSTGLARGRMPLSIHASLTSRLDSLGTAREAAEFASVIGREFSPALLAKIMCRTDADLSADLDSMVASGLIRPSGAGREGGFRFKHALIQDAAYDSIVRPRRRGLHGRVARALRDLAPGLAQTQPQLVATHFTEAGDIEDAVTWWLAAGIRSLQQSVMTEGLEQLGRGLDLVATLPDSLWRRETELALLIHKAKAYVATSGHASDAVGASFRHARTLCALLPDTPHLLTATFGEWSFFVTRGPLREAARLTADIRTLAAQSGDPVHHMFGCYASGMTDTVIGKLGSARAYLEAGIAACAELRPVSYLAPAVGDPGAVMRAYLALIDMCEGRQDACRRNLALALQDAQHSKLTYSVALSLLMRVTIEAFGGAADCGDADLDALRDFARERGMAFFEAIERPLRGWALARRGKTDIGLALLSDGLKHYRATQSGVWVWSFLRMQAEVLAWTARPRDGLALLAQAEQHAAELDAGFEKPVLARVRGELLALSGDRPGALAAFGLAETTARESGAHLFGRQAEQSRLKLLGPNAAAPERALPPSHPSVLQGA